MKPKSLLLFAVAVGCGLVAMVGAQQLLSARNQGVERVRVLVARAEVEPGVKLTPELVGFREIPKESVPQGAVTQEAQYQDRALKTRGFPGQVIQIAQLGEKGQFGTSLDIPAGMRLVTVPASATMIHSGIMKPGDRVDVVLTYKMMKKGSGYQSLTRTILEYIQVYAMGDHRMGDESVEAGVPAKDVKNVTLLVSPVQAEIMKLAESKGQLHLTLRGVLDKEAVALKGTDEAQLQFLRSELSDETAEPATVTREDPPQLPQPEPQPKPSFAEFVQTGSEPAEPAAPVEAPKWKMEVFQGDERKIYEVDLPAAPQPLSTPLTTRNQTTEKTKNSGFWNLPLTQWMTGSGGSQNTNTSLTQ